MPRGDFPNRDHRELRANIKEWENNPNYAAQNAPQWWLAQHGRVHAPSGSDGGNQHGGAAAGYSGAAQGISAGDGSSIYPDADGAAKCFNSGGDTYVVGPLGGTCSNYDSSNSGGSSGGDGGCIIT